MMRAWSHKTGWPFLMGCVAVAVALVFFLAKASA